MGMADVLRIARRERFALLGDAAGLAAICTTLVVVLHALPPG
jgi:hypothetical protein